MGVVMYPFLDLAPHFLDSSYVSGLKYELLRCDGHHKW